MPNRNYKPEQIVTILRQIRGGRGEREIDAAGVQGGRDPHSNILPLAEGVRG